ncbi:SRPBCC family protein [Geodermatophilus sp. DF01-2]|uniref:SRPBCC family protein n=1 Tax=Geodermatophilus sp. DF01-2 TaxID=2559610 RepID=UPI0010744987|nr:SRPBCC family protein [Geodermatophilus sp. DF01_2]TFV63682.1 SRPBCC family protein [Geodermatophilus sp. DF01_2]
MTSTASPGLRRTARLLGLASTGLGVAMLRDPEGVARVAGVDDSDTAVPVITVVGARELVHAAGLLAGRPGWAWTRVAGDAMDLIAMGRALADRRGDRYRRLRTATVAVGVLALVDLGTALRSSRSRDEGPATDLPPTAPWKRAIAVSAATTVNKPPAEVYRYWRNLENLPTFMAHVREIRTPDGGRRSHWVAEAPGRRTVEWDAEVVEDRPDRLIRWRSTGDADIENTGSVEFVAAPGGRGTEVRVHLAYAQPAGRLGKVVATLFGEDPGQQVRDDLSRFKQVLETGQVVRSEGSPEGPFARRLLTQRPAHPRP